MQILFISDYVCPYCLVAKEALRQAMAETGITPDITWHPYELTPEPKPQVDTYHDEKRRAGYQRLVEPCRKLGLDMKLPPNVIPRPRTRLAFEGWYYACEQGKGDAYNDLMYRAYFIDELDIGDMQVLMQLAESIGLDPHAYRAAVESGAYAAQEQAACDHARNVLEIKGVPSIFINGEKIALQTFDKEEMIEILQNEQRRRQGGATIVCNGDSCTVVPEQIVCTGDSCTMPGQADDALEEIPAIPEF